MLLAGMVQATPSQAAAPSATAGLPVGVLAAMQGNADAVRANSAVYLWKRVNAETSRIVEGERTLENAVKDNPELTAKTRDLRDAVVRLRAARFERNSDKTQAAASEVSDRCAALQADGRI